MTRMATEFRSYRLTPQAERDLENIWTYTFRAWSAKQADQYHADLIVAIKRLARGERTGRNVDELRSGYLKYAVGQHVLFYRLSTHHLDVIRILHQRMDIPTHLSS